MENICNTIKSIYDWEVLSSNEFVVLDIETTGFSPAKGSRIIEIGAVKIVDNKVVDEFSTFVNPQIKIPKKITEVTSITNEMVENAPVIGKALLDFHNFLGNAVVVAHNASFDWDRFLIDGFAKVGVKVNNKVVDTQDLSKITFTENKKHNLKDMCGYLGIEVENHHRAIDDAKMTAKALLKFLEIHKENIPDKKTIVKELIKEQESKITIKKVKYWQKANTKRILFQRLYINLFCDGAFGNVYFDIPTKCWYVKECAKPVDLGLVEKKVLEFLGFKNVDELCEFRN